MQSNNNTSSQGSMANELLKHSYHNMLAMYQNRYNTAFFPFAVTWKHISYWRRCVTFTGRELIKLGMITREEYMQQRNTLVMEANEDRRGVITRATILVSM